jgi:hypothetical protein
MMENDMDHEQREQRKDRLKKSKKKNKNLTWLESNEYTKMR